MQQLRIPIYKTSDTLPDATNTLNPDKVLVWIDYQWKTRFIAAVRKYPHYYEFWTPMPLDPHTV